MPPTATLTGTSATVFVMVMALAVAAAIVITAALHGQKRSQLASVRLPTLPYVGLLPAPVVAVNFMLLHFYAPHAADIVSSSRFWFSVFAFLVFWTLLSVLTWGIRRRRARRELSGEEAHGVYRLVLFQTIGTALFIPLIIAAVVLAGAPWWAVLAPLYGVVASLPVVRRVRATAVASASRQP